MTRSRRRSIGGLATAALLPTTLALGCAAHRTIPAGPSLPAVHFVPPCDPSATIALTAEDEKALVTRDQMLLERINLLESMIREE